MVEESDFQGDDFNVSVKESEVVYNILEKDVTVVITQKLLAALADSFTTIPITKFFGNSLCQLMLMYIRQFIALFPLLAMFNLFLEPKTNTDLIEKMVKKNMMNYENYCCASHCILTGHVRMKDVGSPDNTEVPTMVNFSCNNAEVYKQVVLDPLTLKENNLIAILCAVNTDFTEMEEEPDFLASVDNPIQSTKTCMAWDTASSQPRHFTRLDI